MVVYVLGLVWRPSEIMVGLLALILGAGRVFRPDHVAAGGFKVPRHWEAWGPPRYLGAFGLLLGMGVVTTMPSPTMVVLVLWMWHLHALPLILLSFEAFAIGRIAPTAITVASSKGSLGDVPVTANAVIDRMSHLPRVEAAISLLLGLTLLAAAG